MSRGFLRSVVVAALLAWSAPVWAAITLTSIGTNSNTSGATLAITGVTVPANALVVVVVVEYNSSVGIGTVADGVNSGNYSSFTALNPNGSAYDGYGNIFYYQNSSAIVSGTITYTKASTGSAVMSAFYATGVATVSAVDSAVTTSVTGVVVSGSVTSLTSGTPTSSGNLFVGVLFQGASVSSYTQDTGNGWAVPPISIVGTNAAVSGGTQVNSGVSTKTFQPSVSGLSYYASEIVGFKAAAVTKSTIFLPSVIP